MTIITMLNFVTNVCSLFAGSSFFALFMIAIGCMFLLIALIRMVWFIVRIN